MMEWSDRHCRYFWRLLTRRTRLYTEMVTTGALIHGDRARFLGYNNEEHPLALQVGGSEPAALADCARYAEDWGYDEINLNCGCPSDRVQSGKIGAILMAEPERVADCVAAMIKACDIPVTVKHRIGIDDMEDYAGLENFVRTVAQAGCTTFIVHARKAWLKGLSPKENREIPPLKYELVTQLKQAMPELTIVVNGGIKSVSHTQTLLRDVDGVMIGREAYQNPSFLWEIDHALFDDSPNPLDRMTVMEAFMDYCDRQLANGARLHHMTRHVLGLFQGQHGARSFRRHLTHHANKPDATVAVLRDALEFVA